MEQEREANTRLRERVRQLEEEKKQENGGERQRGLKEDSRIQQEIRKEEEIDGINEDEDKSHDSMRKTKEGKV